MKKLRITCLLTALSSNLFAGTMGPSETPSFDGLYLGLGTGVISAFNNDHFRTQRSSSTKIVGADEVNRYTDTAIQFNGNLGYGKMMREKTYLGGKAAIYYSPLQVLEETNFSIPLGTNLVTATNTIRENLKPIYNIDGVLGYELFSRMLAFVEAGVSFSNVTRNYEFVKTRNDLTTPDNTFRYSHLLSLNAYKTSYNVGVGLNCLLHEHFFLAFEVLYNDLAKRQGESSTLLGHTGVNERQSRTVYSNAVSAFASASYLFNI
jgi:outer membrane immunogenic protein